MHRITQMTYVQLAALYGIMILVFGVVYFLLATFLPQHGPSIRLADPLLRLLESFYFSTITATTVGYGDIAPHGISKLLVGFQAVSSLFVFAILVSKPISERQEAALYQMHQLTFDDVFSSVREGFYIMRKDFDNLLAEIHGGGALRSRAWENFATACQEGTVLLEEIPKFYDTERELYIIDGHREELLQEAVGRTLRRLAALLSAFDRHDVRWRQEGRSIASFDAFLSAAKKTIEGWQIWSSHPASETFLELLRHIDELKQLRATNV